MSFEETLEATVRKVLREELDARAPATSQRELLTYAEGAELVGVGERTLKKWVSDGLLPVYGHNSVRRVKPAEVLAVFKRVESKADVDDPENVEGVLANVVRIKRAR